MNTDFFIYKKRFTSFTLLIAYTWLHLKLTLIYCNSTLPQLINFNAKLPFSQRILVPALAHTLQLFLPLSVDELFFLLEFVFCILFFISLNLLLRTEFRKNQAQLLSWLFFLLLPLITVINYRYTYHAQATFFFPNDTATLFFVSTALLLCLQARWRILIPWIFLASLNRESSILLVFLIPLMHWQRGLAVVYKPALMALIAYIAARLCVLLLVSNAGGAVVEWYNNAHSLTNFEINTLWLFSQQNILLFIFCFAGIPLFWFAFYDYIPLNYRPLRYLLLFYFLMLMVVGIFSEARIFEEIVVLMYLPVCLAIYRWLNNLPPIEVSQRGLLALANRYAIVFILALVMFFHHTLQQWVRFLVP